MALQRNRHQRVEPATVVGMTTKKQVVKVGNISDQPDLSLREPPPGSIDTSRLGWVGWGGAFHAALGATTDDCGHHGSLWRHCQARH